VIEKFDLFVNMLADQSAAQMMRGARSELVCRSFYWG
jgi:hypothetical protein